MIRVYSNVDNVYGWAFKLEPPKNLYEFWALKQIAAAGGPSLLTMGTTLGQWVIIRDDGSWDSGSFSFTYNTPGNGGTYIIPG